MKRKVSQTLGKHVGRHRDLHPFQYKQNFRYFYSIFHIKLQYPEPQEHYIQTSFNI